MRKEIFIHFAFLISFLIFVSLFKGFFSFSYWALWLGGIIGTILPDIDHLVYVLFLEPQDLNSQRISFKISKREIIDAFRLMAETRKERKNLIFHTTLFQVIFVILSFWIITSSGSIFGRGLVLGFLLHLLIDQLVDLQDTGNLTNWLKQVTLDKNQMLFYIGVNLVIILIFGFLL